MSVNSRVTMDADPFYAKATREQRRMIFAQERRERAAFKWSPWEKLSTPSGRISDDPNGWTQDVHTVYRNGWMAVLVRDCNSAIGIVQHAAITTALRGELCWREKQKLKDELFGAEACAVEVFPARENLVDAAMMFHLWILPAPVRLAFGLSDKEPCGRRHYRP